MCVAKVVLPVVADRRARWPGQTPSADRTTAVRCPLFQAAASPDGQCTEPGPAGRPADDHDHDLDDGDGCLDGPVRRSKSRAGRGG